MYSMWVLNRKLEKEIEALTLAIKTRKMEIAIDQLLNVQVNEANGSYRTFLYRYHVCLILQVSMSCMSDITPTLLVAAVVKWTFLKGAWHLKG